MSDYPVEYETVDGGVIHRQFAGRIFNVPPEWVRARTDVPPGLEYSTLSKDMDWTHGDGDPERLREYVRDFESVRKYGSNLLISGLKTSFRKKQWAAAGVTNEIVRWYASRMPLTVSWTGKGNIKHLVELRKQRADEYRPLFKMRQEATLLILDEPFSFPYRSDESYIVEDILEYRADRYPTIINSRIDFLHDKDCWEKVESSLGYIAAETIQRKAESYIAEY